MEKNVFEGKIFRVTTEKVSDRLCLERIYQRHGVTVFPCINGRIRFVRRVIINTGTVEVRPMSGYIEDGEDPLTCAKRELWEELGLTAGTWKHFASIEDEGGVYQTQHFYVARRINLAMGDVSRDPDELIHGTLDLTKRQIRRWTLKGKLGTRNAFALLKFVLE
ncbi:MAG: NUDIX domain-containing protein [Patescibacteria group bacterium]|nr:NUDIX domain-containing protein [Patescibacteria group bacterium]